MRILIMATPVAPLGQGKAGGVTLHVINTAAALEIQSHTITIVAVEGSKATGLQVIPVAGKVQPSLASEVEGKIFPIPNDSALGNMWREALRRQREYDVIINFAHDWLPYYLTEFFTTPVYHIVNMTDVNEPTSGEIVRVANSVAGRVAFMSQAQAERFSGLLSPHIVSFGLDLSVYEFIETPQQELLWAGRISPEKSLEDALLAARSLNRKLIIAGAIDNEAYWSDLKKMYRETIVYKGFMPTHKLQALMGGAQTLLQTQKWHEAFGIVTIEAMACGTPVIGYARGANKELIRHGETGLLVAPDDGNGLIDAIGIIGSVSRRACRDYVERCFSLRSYGRKLNSWLNGASIKQ